MRSRIWTSSSPAAEPTQFLERGRRFAVGPFLVPGLRLEMHRRLTALHDSAYDRVESGDSLAAAISAIASKYSELDVELTGGDRP